MAIRVTVSYLEDAFALFRQYKTMAERAMEQVSDPQLFTALDEEGNSIAVIAKHMAGNMRSRWTNFLTTDGEKPDRDRDSEFAVAPKTRAELMDLWESGWDCLFRAIEPLSEADVGRIVIIRGEEHSVLQAIQRQMAHYASHCGQIVFLAKHFRGREWKSLSIPRKRQ